jgi:hypothetical protein
VCETTTSTAEQRGVSGLEFVRLVSGICRYWCAVTTAVAMRGVHGVWLCMRV